MLKYYNLNRLVTYYHYLHKSCHLARHTNIHVHKYINYMYRNLPCTYLKAFGGNINRNTYSAFKKN